MRESSLRPRMRYARTYAFDKFGHGAVVCGGGSILRAWQQTSSDGSDYLQQAQAAVERMKRNLLRYIQIL